MMRSNSTMLSHMKFRKWLEPAPMTTWCPLKQHASWTSCHLHGNEEYSSFQNLALLLINCLFFHRYIYCSISKSFQMVRIHYLPDSHKSDLCSAKGRTVLWDLLNERERLLVLQMDQVYKDKYYEDPVSNPSLVYFLGDRFEWGLTWSASSGRIPTYRKNSAKYVHRQSMCAFTGQDKLASLGWPVTQTLATNMLTTPMPSIDPERSDFLCGNSMHVSNCAIVMLVALCCFGYDPRMI